MTNNEFDLEFDILYNNIMSNQAPGLSKYEKSIFLTQAQEALIKEVYTSGFERNEELKRAINKLVKENIVTFQSNNNIYSNEQDILLPPNVWFITYEEALLNDASLSAERKCLVKPITHDEYYLIKDNPFRGPSRNRVLRIDLTKVTNNTISSTIKLIGNYGIKSYTYYYINKPKPIILENLSTYGNNISIDGVSTESSCELDSNIHRQILNRAVVLAQAAYKS